MIARDVPPIPDSASRQPCGPAPQFTPMTSTSMPSSRFAAANGSVPSGSSTSSPNVSIAMIGRSADATRASSIAIGEVGEQRERLELEEVDATLEQAVDDLAERGPDRAIAQSQHVRGRATERPDRARDQHVATGHVARLAGDLGAPSREPPRLVGQAVRRQPDPVGPEGRGLDEIRTGIEVLAMDRPDQVRARGDQLIEAGPLRDAAREQERAHGPVGQDRPLGQPFAKACSCVHRGTAYRAGRR